MFGENSYILMVETKAKKDMQNTKVIAKADAAIQ